MPQDTTTPAKNSTANVPRLDYDLFLKARARRFTENHKRDGDTPEQTEAHYREQLDYIRERYEQWRALGEFYANALDNTDTPAALQDAINDELEDLENVSQMSFSDTNMLREFYPLMRFTAKDDPHGIKLQDAEIEARVKRYAEQRHAASTSNADAPASYGSASPEIEAIEDAAGDVGRVAHNFFFIIDEMPAFIRDACADAIARACAQLNLPNPDEATDDLIAFQQTVDLFKATGDEFTMPDGTATADDHDPAGNGDAEAFVDYFATLLTHPGAPTAARNFLRGQFAVLTTQANVSLEHPEIVRTAARLVFEHHGSRAASSIYEMVCDGVVCAAAGEYGNVLNLFSRARAASERNTDKGSASHA